MGTDAMNELAPIKALVLLEFVDPDGIATKELEAGDEVDESVADMVAQDACDVVENHYRVKATVVRGFDRLEAIAREILDTHYPVDIFNETSWVRNDPGTKLVVALRECFAAHASQEDRASTSPAAPARDDAPAGERL